MLVPVYGGDSVATAFDLFAIEMESCDGPCVSRARVALGTAQTWLLRAQFN